MDLGNQVTRHFQCPQGGGNDSSGPCITSGFTAIPLREFEHITTTDYNHTPYNKLLNARALHSDETEEQFIKEYALSIRREEFV